MEDIDFLMDFVAGNSNKLQKLGLQGKISWTLNVFTLGPTTQATLVTMKEKKMCACPNIKNSWQKLLHKKSQYMWEKHNST